MQYTVLQMYMSRRHVTELIHGHGDASCIYLESFSFSLLYHRIYAHGSPLLYRNTLCCMDIFHPSYGGDDSSYGRLLLALIRADCVTNVKRTKFILLSKGEALSLYT
jgi:hypothetical protein